MTLMETRRTEAREFYEGVNYAKFAGLAKRLEWSAAYLAERFRGQLETRNETLPHYFARVLDCDPSGEVVIPYRSVIELLLVRVQELAQHGKLRLCACGCGSYPGPGRRLAWDTCREPLSEAQRASCKKSLVDARETASTGRLRGSSGIPVDGSENDHLARVFGAGLRQSGLNRPMPCTSLRGISCKHRLPLAPPRPLVAPHAPENGKISKCDPSAVGG